tara:strand:- start:1138 stop:2196 length:1059 start_codon:yes stop_codon:yes gene_type:complete
MPQFNPNDLKILYAIQGTGNGHIARAMEIIPLLKEYGEVDIVLSGDHKNIDFPMPIKYRSKGLSFAYNKNGGLSFLKTIFRNNIFQIIHEIFTFPIKDYDVVINDFEFITAWSAKLNAVKSFGLGHQYAFLSKDCPRPAKIDKLGEWVLKNYAPVTKAIGFHFDTFDNFVYRPVIRKEVRELEVSNEGYFTVYLPAYGDEYLKKYLSQIPEKRWEIFSKNCKEAYSYKNLHFKPTQNQAFVESLTKCEGILCSAGFETPAEALYLGKKLFTIPIKNQYEQYCNAAALESIGVGVSYSLNSQTIETIKDWARDSEPLKINYPNQTKEIIRREIFDEVRLSILEKDINIERVIY